jgi:serine/threonine-protein kinase
VADKYVIGDELGRGGMGVVVAATDRVLGRRVAIKFLLPQLASSPNAVRRFLREAQVAARITSEHVVTLLEIDTLPGGTPFFVTEYLEGRDLRRILAEDGPLPSEVAVDYLLQALEAVAEGHRRGIVHRDLKPANLFLTERADGTPLVKVLDFGIAKVIELEEGVEPALTGSMDTRLGSPSYMSPEQLQDPQEVDVRSDVWALGVTLYELVSGALPFQGRTHVELVLKITRSPPQPPSHGRSDLTLPRALETVILRCLERDKALRYASTLDLAEALVRFGSAESRVSLKRIRGLSAERPSSGDSLPRRSSIPRSTTQTLPAPSLAGERMPRSSPVPQVVSQRKPATKRFPRALLVGLAVAALLALVTIQLLGNGEDAPSPAAKTPPQAPAKRETPPLEPAPPQLVTTAVPAPAPAPTSKEHAGVAASQPPAHATAGSRPARASAERAVPARESPPIASDLAPAASTQPAASASSSAAPALAAPSPSAASPLPSGRSEKIEELIQRRR